MAQIVHEAGIWAASQDVLASSYEWVPRPEIGSRTNGSEQAVAENRPRTAFTGVNFKFHGATPLLTLDELPLVQHAPTFTCHGHHIYCGQVVVKGGKRPRGIPNFRCCLKCGAYLTRSVKELDHQSAAVVVGKSLRELGPGLRQQRRRILRGLFPHTDRKYGGWKVEGFMPASIHQIQWLCDKNREPTQPLHPINAVRQLSNRWNERPLLLAQFGLIEQSLDALCSRLASNDEHEDEDENGDEDACCPW